MDIFNKEIIVGTHDGTFHSDEAFGCYMLEKLAVNGMKIIRTRNNEQLKECDLVLDVGGEYSHEKRIYDHHQKEFNEKFSEKYNEKLSSAGLIYRHYGMEVLSKILEIDMENPILKELHNEIYENYIHVFDCIDNGVSACPSSIKKIYHEENCSIFSYIHRLNPFNDKNIEPDKAFKEAIKTCEMFFENYAKDFYLSVFITRKIIEDAFEKIGIEASDRIFILEKNVSLDHLKVLEKRHGKDILFSVCKRSDGSWGTRCCTKENSRFESKLPLLAEWRGLTNEKLSSVSGIEDAVFVHSTGFLGVTKSKKSAIKMAELTMKKANLI